MRIQKVFRIKPYFKKSLAHKSIDENINNSDLVNTIIEKFDMNQLNTSEMTNEAKLSKDNVQAIYRLEESNIEKIESFSQVHNLKYSTVLNHILSIYFES